MKCLIVKTSSIGDVIQTFPVVDALKARFPECQIDWVVEKASASLLQAHPDIDQVLVIDTKQWRQAFLCSREAMRACYQQIQQKTYDVLFDFQGNTKSGVINLIARAHAKVGYNWESVAEKFNYFTTQNRYFGSHEGSVRARYLGLVESHFGEKLPVPKKEVIFRLNKDEQAVLERFSLVGCYRPRLMICFGSNWRNKQLHETTLVEFLRLIQEKFCPQFIFMYGNVLEKEQADRLERIFKNNSFTLGRLSLPLWQRYMSVVEGVIAMDSAALHLCGTTLTPSFSFFGPSSSLVYKPAGPQHEAFQGRCPYEIEFSKRCPALRTCKTGACLKNASPQELFDQFTLFWSRVSHSKQLSS